MRSFTTAAIAVLVLTACADPEPTESEVQVAHSNCYVELRDDLGDSAVNECSQELSRIGAAAFVDKYRTR